MREMRGSDARVQKGREVTKYGAKKTPCRHGHTHASGREAKRCNELHLLLHAGEITHLETQVQYWFHIDGRPLVHLNGRRVGYKPDFRYRERNGKLIVEDSKGFAARDWPLRSAMFRALYPDTELREV